MMVSKPPHNMSFERGGWFQHRYLQSSLWFTELNPVSLVMAA